MHRSRSRHLAALVNAQKPRFLMRCCAFCSSAVPRLPVRPSTETCLICSKVGDSPPYEGTSIQEAALPDDPGVFTTLAAGGVAAGDSSLADFPPIRCEREMLLDESLIFRKI